MACAFLSSVQILFVVVVFFFLETCGYSGKTNRTHAPLDKILERITAAVVFSINC